MKTSTILLTLALLFTSTSFAQRMQADQQGDPEIELLIVRNNDGCTDCESYIYERHGENLKKVAFLYPDQPSANSRANLYNTKMIQQVLTEYSVNGYEILTSKAENFDGACNKTLIYELYNANEAIVSNWE